MELFDKVVRRTPNFDCWVCMDGVFKKCLGFSWFVLDYALHLVALEARSGFPERILTERFCIAREPTVQLHAWKNFANAIRFVQARFQA